MTTKNKKFKCYKCGKNHMKNSYIGMLHELSQEHKEGLEIVEFEAQRDYRDSLIKKMYDEDEARLKKEAEEREKMYKEWNF